MAFGADSPRLMQREELINTLDTSSNLFLISFSINDNIKFLNVGDRLDKNNNYHTLLIKAISMPFVGFTPMTTKRGGHHVHSAGDPEIGTINITSYNDINGYAQSFWYNWFQKIMNGSGPSHNLLITSNEGGHNFRLFPNEYKIDIKVLKLSRTTNEASIEYNYYGCWPTNIAGLILDWDSFDSPPIFTVDLKVDLIEVKTFLEPLSTKNLLQTRDAVKDLQKKIIDVSKFTSELAKASNTAVTKKYDKLNEDIKSKLKQSGIEILKTVAKTFEEKVRQSLPDYIRDLDFLNYKRLIDQVYERLEGATKAEISDYVKGFKWPPTNSTAAGTANWYDPLTDITDFPELDLTELIDWNPTNETGR